MCGAAAAETALEGTIALVPLGGWSDQPRQRRRHLSALPLVSVTLRF